MSFVNRIGEIPHNIAWRSWVTRTKKIQVLPDDTQAIIDYVNPAVKKKSKNNPLALSNQIKQHTQKAKAMLTAYKAKMGKKTDEFSFDLIYKNTVFGERTWREINIGIELYSCYFAKTKTQFENHIKKTIVLMRESAKVLDLKIADSFNSTNASGPYIPAKDADEIEPLLKYLKEDFPFIALQHYAQSHVHYNEIRRMCRPYVSVRKEMVNRNLKLLLAARKEAENALRHLKEEKYSVYHENVYAWLYYIEAEIKDLTPPAMRCYENTEIAENDNFHAMCHDQNYRWGEKCWEDFLSFFQYQNFFREDKLDCRATYDKDHLIITMREHNIVWVEREQTWEKEKGGVNQTGFMQIYLDVGNTGNQVKHYTLFFKGEGGTESEFHERADGFLGGTKASMLTNVSSEFTHNDTSWRINVKIPWKKLGLKPKKGNRWRLNIFSNPSVKRNRRVIWCQGYEMRSDIARLGIIQFE